MGRFTLRDEGKTIAVGKVLKYKPAKVQTYIAPTNTATSGTNSNAGSANLTVDAKVDNGASV